jgi:hypothetical protein
MKHSERTFISADSLGYKRVHLFLMELNTHSQGESRLCLKVNPSLKHTFYKSVNSKLNKKNHTHTHTHTHTKC